MSRREQEKKASLDALAKLAYSVGGGAPAAPPPAQQRRSTLPPAPKAAAPAPKPEPARTPAQIEAERVRRAKLEARRAKLEEERALRERRAGELARGAHLEWRGMSLEGVPTSIRRTGFDRKEPDLSTKIQDVLGAAREKEGRTKARDRGRRQGGR